MIESECRSWRLQLGEVSVEPQAGPYLTHLAIDSLRYICFDVSFASDLDPFFWLSDLNQEEPCTTMDAISGRLSPSFPSRLVEVSTCLTTVVLPLPNSRTYLLPVGHLWSW